MSLAIQPTNQHTRQSTPFPLRIIHPRTLKNTNWRFPKWEWGQLLGSLSELDPCRNEQMEEAYNALKTGKVGVSGQKPAEEDKIMATTFYCLPTLPTRTCQCSP